MKLGISTETCANETRRATARETTKKLTVSSHHTIPVQFRAGAGADISGEHYVAPDATVVASVAEIHGQCRVALKVRGPDTQEPRAREGFSY